MLTADYNMEGLLLRCLTRLLGLGFQSCLSLLLEGQHLLLLLDKIQLPLSDVGLNGLVVLLCAQETCGSW